MYIRKCPECNKKLIYTGKWAKSNMLQHKRKKSLCISCSQRGKKIYGMG